MKKLSKLCLMGIMLSALTAGCSAASAGNAAESSTAAAVESTSAEESQAATEAAKNAEAVKDTAAENKNTAGETAVETNAEGALLSTGTYEGDSDFADEDQALFIDENGIEFVAQLSDNTELPEGGLVDGRTYVVTHSEMMTASLPGIYPEVYSITEKR